VYTWTIAAGIIATLVIVFIVFTGNGGSSGNGSSGDGIDGPPPIILGYNACPPEGSARDLSGAGATFPYPLYSKLIDQYSKLCGNRVDYQSIGSGAGIQQITAKTVDFGASDAIMKPDQEQRAVDAGGPILHIPGTLAPVAVGFNQPGVDSGELKLTPDALAGIFLKDIKRWNDPRLAQLNPGVNLPKSEITVLYRSEGSGTTNVFTDYLSKVSNEWKERIGAGNAVPWVGDVGVQGNEGMASMIKRIPGTIGYVELAFAEQVKLSSATLQNASGRFIQPTLESASAAGQGVALPDDTKFMLTNSKNPEAYPIVSFSWYLAYVNAPNPAKGRTLAHFLWWAIHDGQAYADRIHFPRLPEDAVTKAEALILSLRCGEQACLQPATQ
jgi:phosphate transport system substrate-binding protein